MGNGNDNEMGGSAYECSCHLWTRASIWEVVEEMKAACWEERAARRRRVRAFVCGGPGLAWALYLCKEWKEG